MVSLLQRGVGVAQAASPQFQPSSASSTFFNEVSKSFDNIANEMQNKAESIYISSSLTDARKSAREIYEKNLDNPDQLQQELSKYQEGMLSKVPSNLAPRLQNEYSQLAEQYINKATNTKNQQLRTELFLQKNQEEAIVLANSLEAMDDIFAAPQDISEEQKQANQLLAINVLAGGSEALQKNWTAIDHTGKPLYTEAQIASKNTKFREAIFSRAALSYLNNSTNKLKAYDDWINDRVTLELPEGSVNVRDVLSPQTKQKVDADVKKAYKDYLYIQDQYLQRKKESKETFAASKLVDNALKGYVTLDPTLKDNQKAIDTYWTQEQNNLIKQGLGTEDILNQSIELVNKTGILPTPIKSVMTANIMNGNIDERAVYSKYISDVAKENPKLLNELDNNAKSLALSIAFNLESGLSKEQSVEWAINNINEAKKIDLQAKENTWEGDKKYQKKRLDKFKSRLKDEKGFDLFLPDPEIPERLITEYNNLSRNYYINGNVSPEVADKMAETEIRQNWGITKIGGKRYQKFAPEIVYGNQDNWLYEQLETTYNKPIDEIQVQIDYNTINSDKPEYFVLEEDQSGVLDYVLENNQPVKFVPDYAKSRKAEQEKNLARAELERGQEAFRRRIHKTFKDVIVNFITD